MKQEIVAGLIEEALAENPSLFLIDLSIQADNQIQVVIDGDQGVSVNDCIAVSRKIEHNLDREEEDFSLEVTSAGVTAPLQLPRQFKKNLGRKLKVTTEEGVLEGNLDQVEDDKILLSWKAREPKPVGKGKHTVNKEVWVPLEEIKEAKVMITF
ncbi:ribosome assembly cofactor RimP [Mesonia sp. HuA40]|uniref:ribosome assembly cofactor RimP n=1 Tax=Mesonia sp. HuA40 TaxID=2602761 RepID=UPI0011C85380|nr:ribosome assembly cofactor RimP [Mesonia sp. HuA40]TXK73299.1 ribosome assembly cofactor RimP [Mesonia sp. HuA40]